MYKLEYSICNRTDGIEEWADKEVILATLGAVTYFKDKIRLLNKGSMVVFGDLIEVKGE